MLSFCKKVRGADPVWLKSLVKCPCYHNKIAFVNYEKRVSSSESFRRIQNYFYVIKHEVGYLMDVQLFPFNGTKTFQTQSKNWMKLFKTVAKKNSMNAFHSIKVLTLSQELIMFAMRSTIKFQSVPLILALNSIPLAPQGNELSKYSLPRIRFLLSPYVRHPRNEFPLPQTAVTFSDSHIS